MSAFIAGSGSLQDTVPSFSYIKELSYSKYPIYLAANPDTNQQFVIKSFPFHDSRYKKEKEIFMALRHPHIIQLQETIDSTLDRMNKKCSFLKLDYAQHGDLLEIISKYGKLPETLVRTLFHQMLDAINYMHEQNIAHLDLKVDNLLIDENFDLKVTDFDLSQKLSSTSLESRGTPGCRAPEIKQGLCKDLKAADIYSAAIVLFVLLSGNPPYGEVNRGYQLEFDGFYKAFRQQTNRFWETHAKHRGDSRFYSEDFKELFTRMVEEDPATRMTIEEIKETKWYQGPVWDKERCRIEMRKYMNMCTEMCEESKM